jgi:hypothetical protein
MRILIFAAPILALVAFAWFVAANLPTAASSGATDSIAFARVGAGLVVMDSDGSGQTIVPGSIAGDEPFSWTPDGEIAFQTFRDGNSELYTVRPDGSDLIRITNDPAADASPVFSPDGARIAFTTDRETPGNFEIWTMNGDGSGPSDLNAASGDHASWSPDGSQITYAASSGQGLWIMSVDGSDKYRVVDGSVGSPDWSPDGSQIAFHMFQGGNVDVYTFRISDLAVTRLTTDPEPDNEPHWIGDGSQLVFSSVRDGDREIFVMDADGSDQTQLTFNDVTDFRPAATRHYTATTTPSSTPIGTPEPTASADPNSLTQGDVDCNGAVTPVDSLKILRHDAGLTVQQEPGCPPIGGAVSAGVAGSAWGDVDCDAQVSPVDSLKILRFDAGLNVAQEPGCQPIGEVVLVAI